MLQIGLVDRITKPMRQIQKQMGELQKSGIKIASATYAGIQQSKHGFLPSQE